MKRRLLCGGRVVYDEPLHRIGNRFRGQRGRRGHNILLPLTAAALQKLAHKIPAEFLAARGLGWSFPEKSLSQYFVDDLIEHFTGSCNSSAAIEQLAEQLFGDSVDHHISRPSIEG